MSVVPGTVNLDPHGVNAYGSLAAPQADAEGAFEAAARICEAMIVGGRAWTEEQSIAADALFAAAKNIRDPAVRSRFFATARGRL